MINAAVTPWAWIDLVRTSLRTPQTTTAELWAPDLITDYSNYVTGRSWYFDAEGAFRHLFALDTVKSAYNNGSLKIERLRVRDSRHGISGS